MSLDLYELFEKLIVHQNLQILDVIVGLVSALELLLRLMRIHLLGCYSRTSGKTSQLFYYKYNMLSNLPFDAL